MDALQVYISYNIAWMYQLEKIAASTKSNYSYFSDMAKSTVNLGADVIR